VCKVFIYIFLFLTFGSNFLFTQIGLNTFSDSLKHSLYNYNSLYMRDSTSFTIEYPTPPQFIIDPDNYRPSSNPFIFDNRSSSYYVPRSIRDELNHMMNRPKTADDMVSLWAVPIIAAKLAAQYIIVRQKSKIKKSDILNGAEDIKLIELLWQKWPLTINQINEKISGPDVTQYAHMEKRMQVLVDNKLVKMRKIEKSETRYYPAKTKEELAEIVRTILNEEVLSSEEKVTLLSLMQYLE
jgi:hypothetical protein